MDRDFLIQQFGKDATVHTTSGCLFEKDDVKNGPDVLYEIVVKGSFDSVSWQEVYRRISEDLLRAIPALEAAGIK